MPSMFTGAGGAAGYYSGMIRSAPSSFFSSIFSARQAASAVATGTAGGAGTAQGMGGQFVRYATYAAAAKIGYDYMGGRIVARGVSRFVSDRAMGYNMGTDPEQHFYGRLAEATQEAPFGIGEAMEKYYNPYDRAENRLMGELTTIKRGGGNPSKETMQSMYKQFLKEEKGVQEVVEMVRKHSDSVKGSEAVRNQAVVEFGNAVERFVSAVGMMIKEAPSQAAAGVKLALTK